MPEILQQVLIATPAHHIFDALSSQQGLSSWWTPQARAEPRLYSIAHFPFGSGYVKQMKITRLDAPSVLEWLCIAGADEWINTNVLFNLHEGNKESLLQSNPEMQDQIQQQSRFDQATVVHLQHGNWKNITPMLAECSYTWGRFLRSLKLYCEIGQGHPWPDQHHISPDTIIL